MFIYLVNQVVSKDTLFALSLFPYLAFLCLTILHAQLL